MPRVVAVGGFGIGTVASALSLDLATLVWGGGGTVPDLPVACHSLSLGQLPGGRLMVAGGGTQTADGDTHTAAAFAWVPGNVAWTPLPPMGVARAYAAAVVLSDYRMLVAGGHMDDDGTNLLASVEVLASDGSGWAMLLPMAAARCGAVAGRLPGGQVIVAGGANEDDDPQASAELWDPATGAWAVLPPMAQPRSFGAGCMLPSGRFAVLGGIGEDRANGEGDESAEAFDPVSWAWQPLTSMPCHLSDGAVVAVAGGLLAVGGHNHAGAMLFDEESGRWFTLPGQMPEGRTHHRLATVPAP
jgi:hypothetical protein